MTYLLISDCSSRRSLQSSSPKRSELWLDICAAVHSGHKAFVRLKAGLMLHIWVFRSATDGHTPSNRATAMVPDASWSVEEAFFGRRLGRILR